jgi:hypothetical protein
MADRTTNLRLGEEYKTGAHPESYQLEQSGPNVYVNLADLKQVGAIDRATKKRFRNGFSLTRLRKASPWRSMRLIADYSSLLHATSIGSVGHALG